MLGRSRLAFARYLWVIVELIQVISNLNILLLYRRTSLIAHQAVRRA